MRYSLAWLASLAVMGLLPAVQQANAQAPTFKICIDSGRSVYPQNCLGTFNSPHTGSATAVSGVSDADTTLWSYDSIHGTFSTNIVDSSENYQCTMGTFTNTYLSTDNRYVVTCGGGIVSHQEEFTVLQGVLRVKPTDGRTFTLAVTSAAPITASTANPAYSSGNAFNGHNFGQGPPDIPLVPAGTFVTLYDSIHPSSEFTLTTNTSDPVLTFHLGSGYCFPGYYYTDSPHSQCLTCPEGYYCLGGTYLRHQCSTGYWSTSGSSQCLYNPVVTASPTTARLTTASPTTASPTTARLTTASPRAGGPTHSRLIYGTIRIPSGGPRAVNP